MNKTAIRTLFLGLAFIGCAHASAGAQPPILVEGLPTVIVSFADLDLSAPGGQAALSGRIRRAAESLCVSTGVRGVGPAMEQRRCLSFALDHARGQVDRAVAQYGTTQYAGRATITVAGR